MSGYSEYRYHIRLYPDHRPPRGFERSFKRICSIFKVEGYGRVQTLRFRSQDPGDMCLGVGSWTQPTRALSGLYERSMCLDVVVTHMRSKHILTHLLWCLCPQCAGVGSNEHVRESTEHHIKTSPKPYMMRGRVLRVLTSSSPNWLAIDCPCEYDEGKTNQIIQSQIETFYICNRNRSIDGMMKL